MHLLLVEDEDAIRSALTRGLAVGGHTVDGAATLAEARAKAAHHHPDALVTDLKLPDGLGLDLAEELGVPFIQMTGYGTFDDAVRAIRLGCVEFFIKPVSLRDLRRALERVAGRVISDATPTVIDPQRSIRLRLIGDRPEPRPLAIAHATWDSPPTALAAWHALQPAAPCLRHRQVLAELLRLVPSGRVVINRDERQWVAWLDTGDLIPDGRDFPESRSHLQILARRVTWLADGGVVVETPADMPHPLAGGPPNPDHLAWIGELAASELLIPQELPTAEVVDLSEVVAAGTWIHDWFRAHPGQGVVGALPDIRRQFEHAGLPILWRDPRSHGVSAQEKAELFGLSS
jgi:ActR/RegA family two-component response regulator